MSSPETTGAGSATVEVTAPGASGGHRVRSLSEILADRQLRSPTIQRERHEQLRSRLAPGPRASIDVEIGRLVCEFGDSVPVDHILDLADDVLARLLEHARVTQFVPVLTYRHVRARVREERAGEGAVPLSGPRPAAPVLGQAA